MVVYIGVSHNLTDPICYQVNLKVICEMNQKQFPFDYFIFNKFFKF